MDLHNLISLGLEKTLRCFVCKNYLSYFPISLCSNNQSLCGRCAVPEGLISFQEEALETICEFIKFPCRYQSDGCLEELAPRDVPEHEKNCSFRTVQCVISKPLQCSWKGSLPSLLPHCRSEHSDLMLKNGEYQMNLSILDKEYEQWLVHNNVLLIFTIRFDSTSDKLSCALYNHEYAINPETCPAQLSIKNCDRTLLLDLKATLFTEKIFSELSLYSVRGEDKQNSFQCQMNVGNTQSEEHRLESFRTSATILSVLKCSICSELALPPIYLCAKNMSTICSECREQHPSSCHTCLESTTFQKSHTALDTIAILAEYPCKYLKNGCTRTLKYRQMKRHHNVCTYGNDQCPFSEFNACEWKGVKKDVNDHVLKSHQELLVNTSDTLEMSENDYNVNYKLIQFSNHLFRLTYCMDGSDTRFMWSVQTIGLCKKKIAYEIDIVDRGIGGRRMLTRDYCDKLTRKKDIGYSYFEEEQIRGLLVIKDEVRVVKFLVNMYG